MTKTGVLTLAIPKDYKKAIALSLTLKEHSPSLPISVVCPEGLVKDLEPYFDKVIVEKSNLKGFEHKLYLDEYSPYQNTFFFDADVLIIKDITPTIECWQGSGYAVRGYKSTEGISSFGLDRKMVLEKINKKEFMVIDGAGHAYFEKPKCQEIFERGRELMQDYKQFGARKFADEDAMGIAMTMLNIEPKENNGFLGSPWCAIDSSFSIDTNKGVCSYEDALFGQVRPSVVHFPRFVFPVAYAREMLKTYKRHGVKLGGLYPQAIKEMLITKVYWPLLSLRRKALAKLKMIESNG